MTTIVWDGKTMAWDSQATCGGNKRIKQKGKLCNDGGLILVAGAADYLEQVVEAYNEGLDVEDYPDGDYAAIMLRLDGCYVLAQTRWAKAGERMALGSGAQAALAGLALGMTAKEACKLACQVDLYTSLPVQTRTPRQCK